ERRGARRRGGAPRPGLGARGGTPPLKSKPPPPPHPPPKSAPLHHPPGAPPHDPPEAPPPAPPPGAPPGAPRLSPPRRPPAAGGGAAARPGGVGGAAAAGGGLVGEVVEAREVDLPAGAPAGRSRQAAPLGEGRARADVDAARVADRDDLSGGAEHHRPVLSVV